ncbi:unnamed protein product [Victoria cruziana]
MRRYKNGAVWDFERQMPMSPDGKEVVLGVDGGATSTVCICLEIPLPSQLPDPLPVLGRAVAGCSNHNSVGEASARETLEQVIADALLISNSKRSAVRAVCLAISGVEHPRDEQRILKWLREMFPSHVNILVRNDAIAALASGTMGDIHGCVLIAGTGTIAYGFSRDGREARAAGAGPLLGDRGSGYGIAAEALTAVIRAHDGRGPQTTLTRSILQKLGLSSPDEIIGWAYADQSWARVAELVPTVVASADADGSGSFPLVMVGGVFEANKGWDIAREVINCIRKDYPCADSIRPKIEPAIGAALLAWNLFLDDIGRRS